MAKYALKWPLFRKIVRTSSITVQTVTEWCTGNALASVPGSVDATSSRSVMPVDYDVLAVIYVLPVHHASVPRSVLQVACVSTRVYAWAPARVHAVRVCNVRACVCVWARGMCAAVAVVEY